jgi:tetratricopeptide (TPR) repeat protein
LPPRRPTAGGNVTVIALPSITSVTMLNVLTPLDRLRSLGAGWKTRRGYITVFVIYAAVLASLHAPMEPVSLVAAGSGWLVFTAMWFVSSGRLIMPSQARRRMAFCMNVDPEGDRSYQRVLRTVRETVEMRGLASHLKVIDVAPDVVRDNRRAVRFRDSNSLDLLVWGHSYHGREEGQATLRFRIHFTQRFEAWAPATVQQYAEDMALFLGGRPFSIAEQNDLRDYEIVARDLFEVCLLAVAILCLSVREPDVAARLLENVHSRFALEGENASQLGLLQRNRVTALLLDTYLELATRHHQRGDDAAADTILTRMRELAPSNIAVLIGSARVFYRLGRLQEAKRTTEEIRRLDRRHPAVALNNAFFGILERNYERVRLWYERVRNGPLAPGLDYLGVISFLDEEYERQPAEHALLYGIAIVQGLVDPAGGASALRKFLRKVKQLPVYAPLARQAKRILGG